MKAPTTCTFCAIVAGKAPATVVREWDDALAIRPRSGVSTGHVLVIPRTHVADAGVNPQVSARTMAHACELMAELPDANIITSKGVHGTQTQFHLHIHVVPRSTADGLPLPWTPQHEAATAQAKRIKVFYAREDIPETGPAVFLAGPTPRAGGDVKSWRPAAIDELATQWTGSVPLIVVSPESRDGERAEHYDDQVGWETAARQQADAILFWIPRDLRTMPGFTTNVEFGLDVGTGRAVLGCPPDCRNPERNRYLIYVAKRHGVPVRESLQATVQEALALVTNPERP